MAKRFDLEFERPLVELEDKIASRLPRPEVEFFGVVPYDRGDLVSKVHLSGRVMSLEYVETGTKLRAMVREDLAAELREFAKPI